MTTLVKIVLTLVALIIATFLMGVLKEATGDDSPGVMGLVIVAGLLAGLIAMWKYKPRSAKDDNDKHKLDKT